MKNNKFLVPIFILLTIVLFGMTINAQRSTEISSVEKFQVVNTVLNNTLFECEKSEKGIVHLSSVNIKKIVEILPNEVRCNSLKLISPLEIEEKAKQGVTYYKFENFSKKGNYIFLDFVEIWEKSKSETSKEYRSEWKFRKLKNKWVGKTISLTISRS